MSIVTLVLRWNMLKETSKSLRSVINDRLSSPLSGLFVFSWLVFNWKAVSVFFLENVPVTKRIEIINGEYVDSWANLWAPLLLTILLLLLYPVMSIGAYYIWQLFFVSKKKVYIKVGGDVPLTLDESRVLRRELEDKDEEIKRLTAFSSVKSQQLEKENGELTIAVAEYVSRVEELQKELEDFAVHRESHKKITAENKRLKDDIELRKASIEKRDKEIAEYVERIDHLEKMLNNRGQTTVWNNRGQTTVLARRDL